MLQRESSDRHSLTWREVGALVRKYQSIIAVVFLTVVVGTWVSMQVFLTELYETKATLLVKLGRENAETPSTVQNATVLSSGVRTADINSEVQMLSARSLVEAVVDELGPERFKSVLTRPDSFLGYPKYFVKGAARLGKNAYREALILVDLKKRLDQREEAILRVSYGLRVEPVRESDILVLKIRTPSAQLCTDVANVLLREYLEHRVEVRQNSAGTAFFDSQIAENQKRMERLQRERSATRDKWDLSSAADQRVMLLAQRSDIEKEIIRASSEIARLESQRRTMNDLTRSFPAMLSKEERTAANPSIQSIKDELTSLSMKRVQIANRYMPHSETVTNLDAEISALQQLLQDEPSTISASSTMEANPLSLSFTHQVAEHTAQINGLTAQVRDLEASLERIREQLRRLNTGLDEYESVDRQYTLAEQDFLTYSKRREEARVSEDLDARRVANVSLVAAPETPIEPVYPRKRLIMGFSLVAGLLLGIAYAGLLETMDDRIHSNRDLAAIGASPFLGSVTLAKD